MNIDEVAHVLSQNNMYGGRTPYPYSAAQGAVLRSWLCTSVQAFDALHMLDGTATGVMFAHHGELSGRAIAFELQLVCGRGDVPIANLDRGQLTHLREVIELVRRMHPRVARDAYLERHYDLEAK